jgi:hypothetical protein
MTLFNWKKILKDTGGKTKDILAVMHWLTFKQIPQSKKDILFRYFDRNYVGDSFLVNAERLFHERHNYDMAEVMQYFHLASYRSFVKYVHEHTVTLDFFHIEVEEDAIDNNRLLTLEDGFIHFKYEDARRKIWL